jgi:hypothetical protein
VPRYPPCKPTQTSAVLEVLFLPHRDGALERVDRVAARLEGIAAMRGRYGDEHRGLADLEPADAMENGHALDLRPARADGQADLAQLGLGHRGVGLVLEELHRPPARLVAHDAGEDHDAAGARIVDQRGEGIGRERMLDDLEHVVIRAAAHRREQAELVVGAQVVLGLDVVVTDGEERIRTVRRELGVTVDDGRPGRLDRPPSGRSGPGAPARRLHDTGRRSGPGPALQQSRSGGTGRSRSWT